MHRYLEKLNHLNNLMIAEEQHHRLQTALAFKLLNTVPLPAWIKVKADSLDFWTVVYTNREYETRYGIASSDYYFVDDSKIWGEQTAVSFNKVDKQARDAEGIPVYAVEYIMHPISKIKIELNVVKWALMAGKDVVGIAGIVLSEKEVNDGL